MAEQRAAWKGRTAVRWLMVFFGLNVLSALEGILIWGVQAGWAEPMRMASVWLSRVCIVGSLLVLLGLSKENVHYRWAFVCNAAMVVSAGLGGLLVAKGNIGWAAFLLAEASIILRTAKAYFEIRGHVWMLRGADDRLEQSWRRVWEWTVGLMIAYQLTVILAQIMQSAGLMVELGFFFGVSIGACAVGIIIWRLVCLYSTVRTLRGLAAQG